MGQMGQRLGNNGADNDKTAHAFGSSFAFSNCKKPNKNAKELPSKRTTTTRQTKQRLKEWQLITAVLQKSGFSAKFNSSSSLCSVFARKFVIKVGSIANFPTVVRHIFRELAKKTSTKVSL
jgi:hypothetical protein